MRDMSDRLPDEILSRIFSELAFDQLRSCALVASRWKRLCCCVEALHFDCAFLQRRFMYAAHSERVCMLEGLITGTIRANAGPGIHKLVISGPNFSSGALGLWLESLKGTLEVLVLENERGGRGIKEFLVGDHFRALFKCHRLVKLELENWLFTDSSFRKFGAAASPLVNLTSCKLIGVLFVDEDLQLFLRLCPGLMALDIEAGHGLQSPTITSNVLQSLAFQYTSWDLDNQLLDNLTVNSSSLQHISLTYVRRLTGSLPALRDIRLQSACKIRAQMDQDISSLVLPYRPTSSWSIKSLLATLASISQLTISNISVMSRIRHKPIPVMASFFGSLGRCQALEVGADLFQLFRRDIGDNYVLPTCPSMKRLQLYMRESLDVGALSYIAARCPALERVQCFTKLEEEASPPRFDRFQDLDRVLISCHNLEC